MGEGTGNKARGNTLTARRRKSASGTIDITLKAEIGAADAWDCYSFGGHDDDDDNTMRVRIVDVQQSTSNDSISGKK